MNAERADRALDADHAAWLRLVLTPGLGRGRCRRLVAAFGSAPGVLAAEPTAWTAAAGETAATALQSLPAHWPRVLEGTRSWLAASPRRALLALGDAAYPALLLHTADPPLLLFAEGRLELLQRPALAIVGSRKATPGGLDTARQFAGDLAAAGWTIVSGLAEGIDGAAHRRALPHEASTIAVVGTGLDQVYPARHAALAEEIAERGLLLSEFALGSPPKGEHFPQRNRIIAGLSRGTLVVEAALRSGSLITARQAAEMGREVFAVPGSIRSAGSRGCHALLREGAALVETPDDVLAELGAVAMPTAAAPATGVDEEEGDPLLAALGHDPVTLDALVARTGESAAALSAKLLTLELDARVARLPGGLYQRRGRA